MMEKRDDQIRVLLVRDLIPEGECLDFLRDSSSGGIATFSGTTREITDGVKTARLEYDCYPEMALKVMFTIASDARSRWPLNKVCICHRLGTVPVSESSVFVGASSPHRTEAFEAARYLIDTLKRDVPIWKKEYFEDGTSEWIGVPGHDDLLSHREQTG